MIEEVYKKRVKVRRFTDKVPDHNLIIDMMKKTHDLVASKQNLMPYKIHVLDPKCKIQKEELFKLTTQSVSNATKNIQVYAPYVLVFTSRLAEPNEFVEKKISEGHFYQACFPETYHNKVAINIACIEIGMWTKIFTGLCLEHDIDVSYLKCFDTNPDNWSFINELPLFVASVGYCNWWSESARLDRYGHHTVGETKPNFNEVVCFES